MRPDADVLTDIPGKPGRFWGDHTTYLGPSKPPAWLLRVAGTALAHDLVGALAAIRLFVRRHRARGIVTDGGASGLVFAYLQQLFPWGRKPHVLIDCNWYESSSIWRTWLKKIRLQLAARSIDRFIVWASHEVDDYARVFGLPAEKLTYVPFHATLQDYNYEIRDDGYLFAGGNYDRDYVTLIKAVKPLSIPTWIATTRPEQLAGQSIPMHVRVEGTTVAGFRQAMAAAHLVVVPMQPGLLHSGGQQTCLNAMCMGKPTIAIGRKWAKDLICDGQDGLIVDYANPDALRQAICWVMEHPDKARLMGEQARKKAQHFTTERTMRTVYDIVTRRSSTRLCARQEALCDVDIATPA